MSNTISYKKNYIDIGYNARKKLKIVFIWKFFIINIWLYIYLYWKIKLL